LINHKKVNYVLKKYQLILGQTIENSKALVFTKKWLSTVWN